MYAAQAQNPAYFDGLAGLNLGDSSGCPLASFWTLGGFHPSTSVTSGVQYGADNVTFTEPSSCMAEEFDGITKRIVKDFEDGLVDGPGSNRLLFHSSATYTAVAGKDALGGVDGGWLNFDENLAFPGNNGLADTVAYVKDLVKSYPCMTFADASTLVGTIVTELSGGPAVAWMPGRRDATSTPSNPVITTNLPDGSFNTAGADAFYTRMGFTAREMAVVNGGGHSFGGAAPENTGWNGSFTPAADVFPSPKNLFFVQSYEGEWKPQVIPATDGRSQVRFQMILVDSAGEPVLDPDGNYVIRLPSDVALLFGGGEPMAWSISYAKDEDLFLKDYGRVLQRVGQIGAGRGWMPKKEQFEWLGVNGTATNYGTVLEPVGGDPPTSETDIVYPEWVQNVMSGSALMTASTASTSAPSSALQQRMGMMTCALSAIVTMMVG